MTDMLMMLEAGEDNIGRLSDPGALRDAANAVIAFAHARRVTSLLAASPVAERLVGAALMAATEFHGVPTQRTADHESVLVVDVNIASGTAIARAARRARHAGAESVYAAVLHQLTADSIRPSLCNVDELVVLDGTMEDDNVNVTG